MQFTQDNLKDIKTKLTLLEKENQTLKSQNEEYHRLSRDLNRRVIDIEQQLAQNDHNLRRRNILIEGVGVSQGENTLDIAVDIIARLLPNFPASEIEYTQRVSKPGGKKPILVIFKSLRVRDEAFKKKQDLKQYPTLKKIWINEDANPTIRKQKNDSRAVTKQAIHKGHQAQQRGTGVLIDGKYFPYDKLERLPADISLTATRTRTTQSTIGFAGPLAPLSNMHEAPFVHNNTPYNSVEQAHFHTIATSAHENKTAQQILDTKDAFTARNLGKRITPPAGQNNDVADLKALMRKKFLQNPHLLQELLNTGTRRILECTWDKRWAAGHGLDSKLFDTRDQPGENLTGNNLEELRTEFKDQIATGQLVLNVPPRVTDQQDGNTLQPRGIKDTVNVDNTKQPDRPPIPPARTRRPTNPNANTQQDTIAQ